MHAEVFNWKKIALVILFCTTFAAAPPTSQAAFEVGWDFNGLTGYGASPESADTIVGDLTVGGLTRGSGVTTSGTAAADAWGGNGWIESDLNAAVAANDFATFSVTGNLTGPPILRFTEIAAYRVRRSSTAPDTGQWQYQIGTGTFNDIGAAITWGGIVTSTGNAQSAIDLSGISDLQNVAAGTTVTFRLVNWRSESGGNSAGTWYFNNFQSGNDLVIRGEAVPEPTSLLLAGMAGSVGWIFHRREKKKRSHRRIEKAIPSST